MCLFLPSEILCLTVVAAIVMRPHETAAVGGDYISNNRDSCTRRNWKNLSELWQTLSRLAGSGSSE